jgi:hypothetical protein
MRKIITRETHLVRSQFRRNGVAELDGTDPRTVEITRPSGTTGIVHGDYILI